MNPSETLALIPALSPGRGRILRRLLEGCEPEAIPDAFAKKRTRAACSLYWVRLRPRFSWAFRGRERGGGRTCGGRLSDSLLLLRQRETEFRSPPRFTLHPNAPAVVLDDVLHDGQAQARAALLA